ncbi:acetate--CoA ligase family protein [Phreatobacter stygius]|uniref:Acetate--CoA ligase family protein n=1 Tax=Phreatobacter stygius TaxID=1940610 RepID=A0A4D7B6H3_9HYPH|nr:acetate--CoA ligase family protein [Phreatobacter stygius]QCI63782.1 acetate--CoA ligase family protein [Phreatobacter stygius]
MTAPRVDGIDAVLSPHSIAIVGASVDPARIGGRPIRYYKQTGFAGALYPINPNRSEIQGLKAYASLADVPDGLDCVVVAVPPELALPTIEQAAAKGARGAVVFTANYAEAGPEGVLRQQELVAAARAKGMRLLGPNCLGVYNASSGHAATFGSFLEGERAPDAPIGIIGQSGAYASYIYVLLKKRGLGAARWLATGNEADITVADAIGHMAGDDGVKVIAAYVEGVKDGPAFLGALGMARAAGKPVVLIKVGRSESGAAAAMSHTASLAGDDQVFDAVVRQMGGYRARTTEELIDVVEALARRGPLAGNRLGVLTISGGAGVLMADDAENAGLVLPVMPAATQARLKAENPLGSFVNPVDFTAQAMNDLGLVGRALRAILEDGDVDAVAGFFMTWIASPVMGEKLQGVIAEAMQGYEDRTIALAVSAPDEVLSAYRAKGIILNEDPSRVVATLGALAAIGKALKAGGRSAIDLTGTPRLTGAETTEAAAKAFLVKAGLEALPEQVARTPEDVTATALAFGGPVALKIASADIAHKSDAGGVALNVAPDDAGARARVMIQAVSAAHPQARIDGVLVGPMAGEGVELIVAARTDPVFGPVVMVGLGGLFVEVMQDVVFRAAPIGEAEALAMIDSLKGRALLDGLRGRPKVDVAAAAAALAALSRVAAANAGRFDTIEINPLLVRAKGAVMLDALVTPGSG